jgi:hypothetical protein
MTVFGATLMIEPGVSESISEPSGDWHASPTIFPVHLHMDKMLLALKCMVQKPSRSVELE